jgi:uncharacterized membrane protein YsdA (DUF1294 family)
MPLSDGGSLVVVLFLAYYVLASVVLLVLMGYDKWRAVRRKWRVRESTLIIAGFLGGFAGGFLGMLFFRHKTRKAKFFLAYSAAFALHAVLAQYVPTWIKAAFEWWKM